jgi:hypothetical protein
MTTTATKRYDAREIVPQRHYTTDSARHSRDTLNALVLGSPEERAYVSRTGIIIGLDLGVVWDGTWRHQLDRMDRAAATGAVADRMMRLGRVGGRDAEIAALADYLKDRDDPLASSEASPGPSGTLTFGTKRPEKEFGPVTTPAELNRDNAEHWSETRARPNAYASDSKHRGPATPASMNASAKAFWAAHAVPQPYDRKWGRG